MSSIEDKVCELIQRRAEIGLATHGRTMDRDDYSLTEWCQEALEEALDHAIYLQKIIEELKKKEGG